MTHYVYVFFDPQDGNKVFYVGKGTGNRPKGHLAQSAVSSATTVSDPDDSWTATIGADPYDVHAYELSRDEGEGSDINIGKVDKIQQLTVRGVTPKQMIRVIARDLDDSMAKTIEAFTIRFIFGLDKLTNMVEGAKFHRFRPAGNWEKAYWTGTDTKGSDYRFYVYVLRDPNTKEVLYVGKGTGRRLLAHSNELPGISEEDRTLKHEALDKLHRSGYASEDIARIIACDLDEEEAFAIESFTMKYLYGMNTNKVRGHGSYRFRAKNDWTLRLGFDLPFLAADNAQMARLMEVDQWRAEGLEEVISAVVAPIDQLSWRGPVNHQAGALGFHAIAYDQHAGPLGTIHVFIRTPGTRTVTVEARFHGKEQRKCFDRKFGAWWEAGYAARVVGPEDLSHKNRRKERVFLPDAWANKPTSSVEVASQRIRLMLALLQAVSRQHLTDLVGNEAVRELLNEDEMLRAKKQKNHSIQSELIDDVGQRRLALLEGSH